MDAKDATCLHYLKALSDDTRWQIVQSLISADEPLTLGELAAKLGISNYKASHHVSVLEEVGILETRKEGRRKYLSVAKSYREQIASREDAREVLNLGCCSFKFPREQ
jgi:DNA-binding transcriptional ArsR family regulator